MSSYRQIYYHLVFRTKNSVQSIDEKHKENLYKYIWGIVKNKNCKLYRINGMPDHIHLLTDLHPSISLADFVKEIKVASSIWLKQNNLFPKFEAWAEGYGAFTISQNEKERVMDYIKNQEEHHKEFSFADEYRNLLKEFDVEIDEKYFLK
jgi:REP element-mobilizing transposase RayT